MKVPVVPVLISLALLATLALLLRFPPLGDVTTTPEDPPRFRAQPPGDVPYPDRFAGLQRRAYPDLSPLQSRDAPAETLGRAAEAAQQMEGWRVVLRDDSLRVFQAVAETPLFGFEDDVVVEVRAGGGGSQVHVRSRSRIGRSDFGANARRIRDYLSRLE
ncbi:MAG: DUF1499 domain-containing protein [Gemmatimonadota bacterium]